MGPPDPFDWLSPYSPRAGSPYGPREDRPWYRLVVSFPSDNVMWRDRLQSVLPGHPGGTSGIAFSPSGECLISGGTDGQVRVWEVKSGRELRTLPGHTDAVSAVAVHRDGRTFTSGSRDRSVRVWSLLPEHDH